MVFTSASGIHIDELRLLERTRQLTFTSHGVIDALSSQPFHILISTFHESNAPIRTYGGNVCHGTFEFCDEFFIHSLSSIPMETSQILGHFALRDEHSVNWKA